MASLSKCFLKKEVLCAEIVQFCVCPVPHVQQTLCFFTVIHRGVGGMCLVCGEYAWSVLLVDVGFDCNGGIFLRVCDVGLTGVPVGNVVVFR